MSPLVLLLRWLVFWRYRAALRKADSIRDIPRYFASCSRARCLRVIRLARLGLDPIGMPLDNWL